VCFRVETWSNKIYNFLCARTTTFTIHFEGVWSVLVYKPFESMKIKQCRTILSFVIPTIHNNSSHIAKGKRKKEAKKEENYVSYLMQFIKPGTTRYTNQS